MAKTEFGRGLTYCIGLFLKHYERYLETRKVIPIKDWTGLWFNAASDHLYDLDTSALNGRLKKRVETWKHKCLIWGHGFREKPATMEDFEWSIHEAEKILREIDEKMLKTKTAEGCQ